MKRNRGKRARGEREKEEKFEANQKDVNTLKFSDEPCEKEGGTCYVIFLFSFLQFLFSVFATFVLNPLKHGYPFLLPFSSF